MNRLRNKNKQLYQLRLQNVSKAGVLKDHVVIVVPTYNESENIGKIIEAIQTQSIYLKNAILSILVVDDFSPDGTAQIVQTYVKKYKNVHLLKGRKAGLGNAYIRGFKYAMRQMGADIVFEMDADFSHDPSMISFFVYEIQKGNDFVIGSRYIDGGSIPAKWPRIRKLNSQWGNIFARHIAGLGRVKDCTSGFRAIRTSLLKRIHLNKLKAKGYAFQIDLLHKAIQNNAIIKEIPIQFTDRIHGNSKLSKRDIIEFIFHSFTIRMPYLVHGGVALLAAIVAITAFSLGNIAALAMYNLQTAGFISNQTLIILVLVTISVLMIWQSVFSIFLMLYGWEDVERIEKDKVPQIYEKPKFSFTALLPVRHEEHVIGDTIRAIAGIDYPEGLKETLVIVRSDDNGTIARAQQTITELNKPNVRLVIFNDMPINKPHSLNIGLMHATKDVIVVFDAEDQPSRSIYNIANTQMTTKNLDVLQSGVQLMNFKSNWFSTLNVLEYFFWFKSALHYFAKQGIIPLGGNTVFFKRKMLGQVGGWDEACLTEDAEIGIRLSARGASIGVVYDEKHTTQEETPHNLDSFIKQRTRWNQGFIQILWKGEWLKLPKFQQRFLAGYILLVPQLQAFFFLMLPISIFLAFVLNLPVIFAMITFIPLLLLLLQLVAFTIGMYEFTKGYGMRFPFWLPFKILYSFYPFQIILGLSAMRAILRLITGNGSWEKTLHLNAHRPEKAFLPINTNYIKIGN
ncbi:MAG: glycosyltransferase [Candidatus Levybacteria bacterium]|nr:glycosyltransferase [Candidatus Levybacteria bacterium]